MVQFVMLVFSYLVILAVVADIGLQVSYRQQWLTSLPIPNTPQLLWIILSLQLMWLAHWVFICIALALLTCFLLFRLMHSIEVLYGATSSLPYSMYGFSCCLLC